MFAAQGIKPGNSFPRYLLGSFLIFLGAFIGQVPMVVAIVVVSLTGKKPFPMTDDGFMDFFSPNVTLFWIMLSFFGAMLVVWLVVKYLHKQTFLSVTTSRPAVDWRRIFFSFGLWTLFIIVSTVISYYAAPEDYKINFNPVPFAILVLIATLMIPVQTSCEEYVFRGYLMQGFAGLAKNKWFPLMMTSLIFGGLHFFNPEVGKMGPVILIYYVGTGLFLGILTLMDEGMELSLGFHAANNLVGALLVTSDWSALKTDSVLKEIGQPGAGYEMILPVFIIYPILLLIFSRKYHWTNWKEKLSGKIDVEPLENTNGAHKPEL